MKVFEDPKKAKLFTKISWGIIIIIMILTNISIFVGEFEFTINNKRIEPSFLLTIGINLVTNVSSGLPECSGQAGSKL